MIGIGMILLWAGYGVSSWGYVLVRGWDIPFGPWFNPLRPYQWPKSGDPPVIPQGALLPGQAGSSSGATTPSPGVKPAGGTSVGQLGEPGQPGVPKGWPTRDGTPVPVAGKCPPGWFEINGQCKYPIG